MDFSLETFVTHVESICLVVPGGEGVPHLVGGRRGHPDAGDVDLGRGRGGGRRLRLRVWGAGVLQS